VPLKQKFTEVHLSLPHSEAFDLIVVICVMPFTCTREPTGCFQEKSKDSPLSRVV